jgi:hypothetical protein
MAAAAVVTRDTRAVCSGIFTLTAAASSRSPQRGDSQPVAEPGQLCTTRRGPAGLRWSRLCDLHAPAGLRHRVCPIDGRWTG